VGTSTFEAPGGRLAGSQRVPGSGSHARGRRPAVGGGRLRPLAPGRQTSASQRAAGLLIAIAAVLGTVWYVHQVALADTSQLTGTVISTGELNLNFVTTGQVAAVLVTAGQRVRAGQLLATEAGPATAAVAAADRAAVTADRSRLKDELAAGNAAEIASAQAGLARDEAQLARDDASQADSRITAPAAGTVLAVNVQPGDPASAAGVRDYPASAAAQSASKPLFSLLPQQPEADPQPGAGSSALPAVELATTASWRVLALLPEREAASVRAGEAVTVAIPEARLSGLAATLAELVDTPVQTGQGASYQAVVVIERHGADLPLDGMSANIRLARPQ
jgi:multidrug efflux pump subunit AcrA (membrane-fusion protein)